MPELAFSTESSARTGLAGIIVTVWCGLRGWPKDVQRAVFQPISVAVFAMSAVALGWNGAANPDTLRLFAIGLPILLAGTWLGLRLYGRVDESRISASSCWDCSWRRALR